LPSSNAASIDDDLSTAKTNVGVADPVQELSLTLVAGSIWLGVIDSRTEIETAPITSLSWNSTNGAAARNSTNGVVIDTRDVDATRNNSSCVF